MATSEFNSARKQHYSLGHINTFENCGFKECKAAQSKQAPSIVSDYAMRTTHRSQESLDSLRDRAVESLAISASRILLAFRNGRNPTFDQLDKLEACLMPFETDKLCGHKLFEECDCLNV